MPYTPEIKNTCGPIQFATCTLFEGIVPAISGLTPGTIPTVEGVLSDNYALISSLYTNLDLTGLGANGLSYPLDINSKITPRAAIVKHGDEIVELKSSINNLLTGFDGNLDISDWGIDFSCLEGDHCGLPITTLKQLLQAIVVYSCEGIIVPITTSTTTTTTTVAPEDVTPPSAPVLTLTGVASTTIDVSWTAATDNVGVVDYVVETITDEMGAMVITFPPTAALSLQLTGLPSNTYQNITVYAQDAAGNRTGSNTVRALTLSA